MGTGHRIIRLGKVLSSERTNVSAYVLHKCNFGSLEVLGRLSSESARDGSIQFTVIVSRHVVGAFMLWLGT